MTTHYFHPHTGGIETVAVAHGRELAQRGWNVDAHSSWTERSAPRVEHTEYGTVHRHRVWNPLERSLRLPVPLPWPGVTRAIARAAASADVVVAHGHVYPISVAAARAAAGVGRPLVLVQHSPWVDYPFPLDLVERAADRAVGRWVLEQAEAVVCVSRFTEEYVRSIAPRARTEVIANGVDTRRFVPGTACVADRPMFVCVRRLVPRNGVDLLLEAWQRAELSGIAELVIAGDGPERSGLEARALGLSSVSFVGRVSDDALVSLLQRARASIVPTRSGEGFGLVAAESLACGTPVIATDQGALGEVVRDGLDGLVVRQDDPDALAAAIRRLAVDADLTSSLATGARSTDWSWSRTGAELDALLRRVVSSPLRRR
jgi:glycosyltransferase involved in cell wall biosynthesis